MKSIIPTYITIVGFCFIMLLCTSLLAVQMQISGARTFHASCLNRIQSSLYSENVITACKEEAGKRGYAITVTPVSIYKGRESKLVTLDYNVVVPFLSKKTVSGTVTGYGK